MLRCNCIRNPIGTNCSRLAHFKGNPSLGARTNNMWTKSERSLNDLDNLWGNRRNYATNNTPRKTLHASKFILEQREQNNPIFIERSSRICFKAKFKEKLTALKSTYYDIGVTYVKR